MSRAGSVYPLACALAVFVSGCATTGVPSRFRERADRGISFAQIRNNPKAYKGKTVLWGGEILDVRNVKDGTYVEILQAPVSKSGEPKSTEDSAGRFIAFTPQFLDREIYTLRRKISVVGEVQGTRTQTLTDGEAEYVYPFLNAEYVHLWPLPKIEPSAPPVSVGFGFGWFGW